MSLKLRGNWGNRSISLHHFVLKFEVKWLESSLIHQYVKVHQRTFFRFSSKFFYISFDILISIYRMDLISLPMDKAMLQNRFKYQDCCVPTISRRFKAIWSQSFDPQLFEMRFSKILQIEFFKFFKNIFTFILIFLFLCVVWFCFFTNE